MTTESPAPGPVGAVPPLGELPEPLRSRVVALAAEVLPDVPRLPVPLRRVAGFAPQRRARLGARAIGEALESDDEFRESVATQVSGRDPRRTTSPGDAGGLGVAGDPVELGATAWLVRPEGAAAVVAGAVAHLEADPAAVEREVAQVERLRRKLDEAEQALRDLRTRTRSQVEEYKSENASLRRKLGETRASERSTRARAEELASAAEVVREEAQARSAGQDRELRQLRGRVAELEAELAAGRRAARSERDEATVRARMLLDTVIDAASGLRRELALPAVEGAPADRVESALGAAAPTPAAARGGSSPAQLERVLALPRARLVVDGYNVSKTAWPTAPLEDQRTRLLRGLAALVARLGVETTVVFDAAAAASRAVVAAPRGVKVVFSPEGVIADDVIRDLVAAEPPGRVVVVVSSDQEVARDVTRAGARSHTATSLIGLLG